MLEYNKGGELMEKDRKTRFIAIAALLFGVVGLSLGFAAFSNTLTIKSSAEVNVDSSKFNVDFSSSSAAVETNPIEATLNKTVTGFSATNATIDNSGDPVIQNLHATFTEPGQKATYTFYTKNAGELKAYLKNVTFANVSGQSATKVCTASEATSPNTPATNSLVQAACEDISLKLTLGSEVFTASKARAAFSSATAHDLIVDGSETVTVEIEYAQDGAQADGDFDVSFGDITLLYSSAE